MKGVGTYSDARPGATAVELGGKEVLALSLEQLISAKRAAGRPKDRDHVIELEAIRELARE